MSTQERKETTPARDHRIGTSESRAAGGSDLDPITREARNASTEYRSQVDSDTKTRDAENLARLANRIQYGGSSAGASGTGVLSTVAGPATTADSSKSVIPSGYSTDTLPLRTDPTLEAFVNNLMKDGKKAQATRITVDMLQYLARALHADPLPALQAAILSAGPMVRMQTRKKGGKNVGVPVALRQEQSRRRAIVSIITASSKRNDSHVSTRLAKEVIAVLEGNSTTLTRKEEMHRQAMVNRSNALVR